MNTVQILDTLEETLRGDRSDSQLLDCFVRLRDEDAFAAVVRRHGPMVLGVCRRVLRNDADADDAFQAAFLVLARKAATIGTRHLLAQWLYGVAFNTARKLRRSNSRRATREQPLRDSPEPAHTPDATDELLAILDEELHQLPERYRAVIVLCDLEGLTRREAATRLACPEGTVAGRLARARDLLAARLSARGVTSAAALLAAVFAQQAATALPPALISGVIRAVGVDSLAHATAEGLISPRVADTTEGVLRAMFLTKLWVKSSAALCCGVALACAVGAWRFANAQPVPSGGSNPLALPEKPGKLTESSVKVLTVLPLKKLDPEATAKVIADAYKGKGVTVAGVAGEGLLLLHADAKATAEIQELLKKLGETLPASTRLFRLAPGTNVAVAAQSLDEVFNGPSGNRQDRVTVVPLANANALLVFAGPTDLLTIEKLLGKQLLRDAVSDPAPPAVKTVTLDFVRTPWDDVLDWYAKETGLTLITTVKPTGSLTLRPGKDRKFTMAEVTDLLNEALLQQKFLIFRRRMTFFLIPTDEHREPRDLLSGFNRIELSELKNWGRTELVEVRIPLHHLKAAEVEPELRKLLTPFGKATAVGQTLIVGDTRGNIERILKTLEAVDGEKWDSLDHVCKWRQAQEVAETLKTLLTDKDTAVTIIGAAEGANARGKAVLIAVDVRRNAVVVTGPPDKLALARRIIAELDKPPAVKKYSVKFQKSPWKDVFAWYAEQSGLMFVGDTRPVGTFTLTPPEGKEYTLAEIADFINEALLAQKWLLVRGERSFTVIPVDEKIDPKWVPLVKLEELDRRGSTELVRVLIQPNNTPLDELAAGVKKMIGPFGEVVVLVKAGGIVVQDTAGNLRAIVKTVRDLDDAPRPKSE